MTRKEPGNHCAQWGGSQPEEHGCMPFIRSFGTDEYTETETSLVVARGWSEGVQWGDCNGYAVSFWGNEKCSKIGYGNHCITL